MTSGSSIVSVVVCTNYLPPALCILSPSLAVSGCASKKYWRHSTSDSHSPQVSGFFWCLCAPHLTPISLSENSHFLCRSLWVCRVCHILFIYFLFFVTSCNVMQPGCKFAQVRDTLWAWSQIISARHRFVNSWFHRNKADRSPKCSQSAAHSAQRFDPASAVIFFLFFSFA